VRKAKAKARQVGGGPPGSLIEANTRRLNGSGLAPELKKILIAAGQACFFAIDADMGSPPAEKDGNYYLSYAYITGFYPTDYLGSLESNLAALYPLYASGKGKHLESMFFVSEIVPDVSVYKMNRPAVECVSTLSHRPDDDAQILKNLNANVITSGEYNEHVKELVEGDPEVPEMAALYTPAKYTRVSIRAAKPDSDSNEFFKNVLTALKNTKATLPG
jgi:hypothetical protein